MVYTIYLTFYNLYTLLRQNETFFGSFWLLINADSFLDTKTYILTNITF